MVSINDAPCIECERKGCGAFHDKCEKYLEYSNRRKVIYEDNKKSYLCDWHNGKERIFGNRPKFGKTPKAIKGKKRRG